nr:unnamed protein product [Spirometra erinaceieuropaei]
MSRKLKASVISPHRCSVFSYSRLEQSSGFSDVVALSTNAPDPSTTILAAYEDIQEGQLVVLFLLHRKLYVREDRIQMFLECQKLVPDDKDEGIINILGPALRYVMLEDQQLQPLQDGLGDESRNRRTYWSALHLFVDCPVEGEVCHETELQELKNLGVSKTIIRFIVFV